MWTIKNEVYIFKADLAGEKEEVKLNMKMDFGSPSFAYSNNVDELTNVKKHSMDLPLAKLADYEPPLKPLEIKIFRKFYLNVDAKKLADFIFNIRGTNMFLKINPFETQMI